MAGAAVSATKTFRAARSPGRAGAPRLAFASTPRRQTSCADAPDKARGASRISTPSTSMPSPAAARTAAAVRCRALARRSSTAPALPRPVAGRRSTINRQPSPALYAWTSQHSRDAPSNALAAASRNAATSTSSSQARRSLSALSWSCAFVTQPYAMYNDNNKDTKGSSLSTRCPPCPLFSKIDVAAIVQMMSAFVAVSLRWSAPRARTISEPCLRPTTRQ
mmetsp:Transcript_113569/g.315975  ORF Transcript_113569/g.315975 Transcript_113569/m.315975 type:complete len:221 (-) Transcript_113569:643-1305(-)